ncbi:MAG: sigma 54-interacting transcriptional regulator [Pseudomonadota bacterium]
MTEKQLPEESQEDLRERLEMHELIFESIFSGAMVTDPAGHITHFNTPYARFLGLNREETIGRHCTECVENTRMHIVAQTGIAEINHAQQIRGKNMVVQRIPIKKDGKVLAVFGQVTFKDVRDVHKLASRLSLLESKVKMYEQELMNLRQTRYTFDSIIARSSVMRELKAEALKAAGKHFPVLITGESGTGKELFAQAIHNASDNRIHPFVRINCAAIPRDLLESELFGYDKGAFTGARASGKPGKFELAHRGTIFLDEIGDLPIEMQPKLLRVLEEKEFERVGGNTVIRSDFRLIAATNRRLEDMMASGGFREDLFYRLNVVSLHIPPLRERREDIIPLFRHLLQGMAEELNAQGVHLEPCTEKILGQYDWPGNVRELSNVMERILATLDGNTIRRNHLPLYLFRNCRAAAHPGSTSIRDVQQQAAEQAIRNALESTGGNKARAARLLGIHRTLLYKKLKKYGISI